MQDLISRLRLRELRSRARALRALPACEPLEERVALAVFNVTTLADTLTPPSGTVTLRSAIQAANTTPGPNTINLTVPGIYQITHPGTRTDNSAGEFAITGTTDLTIANTSGGTAIVDGGGLNRVFDVNPAAASTSFTVKFQGFMIDGGSAATQDSSPDGSGGAIRAKGGANVELDNMLVSGNTSTFQGGGVAMVQNSSGNLTLNNSAVTFNHTSGSGGGIYTEGTGNVFINAGSVLDNNVSQSGGGGVWVDSGNAPLTLVGVLVTDNVAVTGGGGGIGNKGPGLVTITNSLVAGNFSGSTGGGFDDDQGRGSLKVMGSHFLNNRSLGTGAGIHEGGSSTAISNSFFQGNDAGDSSGGALWVGGPEAGVSGTVFRLNSAANGAAIEDDAVNFTLLKSSLVQNHALTDTPNSSSSSSSVEGNGAGLDIPTSDEGGQNQSASVSLCLFVENTAHNGTDAQGGGIYAALGNLTVNGSQFTNNAADVGGAIRFLGTRLTLTNSTFDHNRSLTLGGAVAFSGSGTSPNSSTISYCTFAFNNAGADGGGVADSGPGDLGLVNDTVNDNYAASNGGGFALESSTASSPTFKNDLVALNGAGATGPDVYTTGGGTVVDSLGNFIGTLTGATGFGGTVLTGNPQLLTLLDNAGLTAGAPSDSQVVQTEALLASSPALGTGVVVSGATDERGFGLYNGRESIGAYEAWYDPTSSQNYVFAENLIEVFYNVPNPGGATALVTNLNNGVSSVNETLALTHTAIYDSKLVTTIYQTYLNRAPSAQELTDGTNLLLGGASTRAMQEQLVSSNEYFMTDNAGSDILFLESLYEDALTTENPMSSQSAQTLGSLYGGQSLTAAATGLFNGVDYLTSEITSDFWAYIGFAPPPVPLANSISFLLGTLQGPSVATENNLNADLIGLSLNARTKFTLPGVGPGGP
jgi:hypothetical protein